MERQLTLFKFEPPERWAHCCSLAELVEGKGRALEVEGVRLAIFKVEGEIFILGGTCPHANAPLGRGWLEDGCVVCPLHRWKFSLATGACRTEPGHPVQKFPARVDESGEVWADLSGIDGQRSS